jgi:hypothetical protein
MTWTDRRVPESDGMDKSRIPLLTEAVGRPRRTASDELRQPALTEPELAELQTRIATGSFMLVERLLHNAFKEMEATLFDEVVTRLRSELPDLIDQVLREHFERESRART